MPLQEDFPMLYAIAFLFMLPVGETRTGCLHGRKAA